MLAGDFTISCVEGDDRPPRYDRIENINVSEYLRETDAINCAIDEQNDLISKYNAYIDDIISKINNLEKWGDFIEFKCKYYGVHNVYDSVHRELDCGGAMVFYNNVRGECRGCRDGMPFGGSYTCNCTISILNKCNRRGYEK